MQGYCGQREIATDSNGGDWGSQAPAHDHAGSNLCLRQTHNDHGQIFSLFVFQHPHL